MSDGDDVVLMRTDEQLQVEFYQAMARLYFHLGDLYAGNGELEQSQFYRDSAINYMFLEEQLRAQILARADVPIK